MIELKNVSKKYDNTTALDNVSLTIDRGEIIGLFGENGAGKTTLIKSILNLIPYKGTITLDGEEINRKNAEKLSFATAEHTFFPELTMREHRWFYERHFPKFRAVRFDGLVKFFELPLDKPLKTLSLGQQNQCEVILALSQGADYIFMDEPFTGNDVFNREDFYKVLSGILEENETVFLSTHLIEEVSTFIARAVLIKDGRIIGDVTADQLDEEGKTLIDYVKETYGYQKDRVMKALAEMGGGAE